MGGACYRSGYATNNDGVVAGTGGEGECDGDTRSVPGDVAVGLACLAALHGHMRQPQHPGPNHSAVHASASQSCANLKPAVETSPVGGCESWEKMSSDPNQSVTRRRPHHVPLGLGLFRSPINVLSMNGAL